MEQMTVKRKIVRTDEFTLTPWKSLVHVNHVESQTTNGRKSGQGSTHPSFFVSRKAVEGMKRKPSAHQLLEQMMRYLYYPPMDLMALKNAFRAGVEFHGLIRKAHSDTYDLRGPDDYKDLDPKNFLHFNAWDHAVRRPGAGSVEDVPIPMPVFIDFGPTFGTHNLGKVKEILDKDARVSNLQCRKSHGDQDTMTYAVELTERQWKKYWLLTRSEGSPTMREILSGRDVDYDPLRLHAAWQPQWRQMIKESKK